MPVSERKPTEYAGCAIGGSAISTLPISSTREWGEPAESMQIVRKGQSVEIVTARNYTAGRFEMKERMGE
jgi:hypothetical protein